MDISQVSGPKIELRSNVPFSGDQDNSLLRNEIKSCIAILNERLLPLVRNKEWDVLRVEYWFDSGSLVVYPRNSAATPYDRLDEYVVLFLHEYALAAENIIYSSLPEAEQETQLSDITNKVVTVAREAFLEMRESVCSSAIKSRLPIEFFDCDFGQLRVLQLSTIRDRP